LVHRPPGALTAIEISGLGYQDKITSATPIREFRDRLRASEFFAPSTEITWLPTPGQESVVREFKIIVVLKQPITV
jgi:hypothetical protein